MSKSYIVDKHPGSKPEFMIFTYDIRNGEIYHAAEFATKQTRDLQFCNLLFSTPNTSDNIATVRGSMNNGQITFEGEPILPISKKQ
jgi:hypothetical protein